MILIRSINWVLAVGILLFPLSGKTWENHQQLMPLILNSFSPELKTSLEKSFLAPCKDEDLKNFQNLVVQLQLNPNSTISSTSASCEKKETLTLSQVLSSPSVDEPDQGMDQNLPADVGNSFDPKNDRHWMGGYSGLGSQGFRHMYFGGWSLFHPITTFQIPIRPLGQAPYRLAVTAQKAKELIQAGNWIWGMRVLAWSIHYAQDLGQPYHAAQLIHPRLAPWYVLLTWSLSDGFQRLVLETTRIVGNFHLAYEGYVGNRLSPAGNRVFEDCLTHPQKYSSLKLDLKKDSPQNLGEKISQASIEIAYQLGKSEIQFFGPPLFQPDFHYKDHPESLRFDDYSIRPDLAEPRQEINDVTCRALANTALASRFLIEWALQP